MSKLKKNTILKYLYVSFCVIVQTAWIVLICLMLNNHNVVLEIALSLCEYFVLFLIFSNNTLSEFKVCWLLLFVVSPILCLLFFLFSVLYPKDYKFNQRHPCAYSNTATEFYGLGMTYFNSLIDSLKNAERYVFIEMYVIKQGKMWNVISNTLKDKLRNGVEVYVMYDNLGSINVNIKGLFNELINEGVKVIPSIRFNPFITRLYNNRDHKKLVVIDGKVCFVGGINIGDEYINIERKFGFWSDCAVKLEGQACEFFVKDFIDFWNNQSKEKLQCDKYLINDYNKVKVGGKVIPVSSLPIPFSYDKTVLREFVRLLYSATKSVYITTPYFVIDETVKFALTDCVNRGVKVKIVIPHIPDKKSVYLVTRLKCEEMLNAGIEIYEYLPGFIHSKIMIIDGMTAFVGSANLDFRSFYHNCECGVIISDVNTLKEIKRYYSQRLNESHKMLKKDKYFNLCKRFLAKMLNVIGPLL